MGERELVSESFLTVRERAVCVWMGGGEKKCVDVRESVSESVIAVGELALFVGEGKVNSNRVCVGERASDNFFAVEEFALSACVCERERDHVRL